MPDDLRERPPQKQRIVMTVARPRVGHSTQDELGTDVAAGRAQRLLVGHMGGISQDDVERHLGEGLGQDVQVPLGAEPGGLPRLGHQVQSEDPLGRARR